MGVTQKLFNSLFSVCMHPLIISVWARAAINQFNTHGATIPCPYCGQDRSEKIFRWEIDHPNLIGLFDTSQPRLNFLYGRYFKHLIPQKVLAGYIEKSLGVIVGRSYVDYHRCSACDLVFQNFPHTPASHAFYYRELYRLRYQDEQRGVGREVYGRNDQRWVYQQESIGKYFLKVTQLHSPAKILDVGCGEGLVCKYLEREGLSAFGIEPSLLMAHYARVCLQLKNIICGNYTSGAYPENFFDGIISHHVVEHVLTIDKFFEALRRHLKPGGVLLLQTPCVDNLKTEDDYRKILCGGHIYCFSERFLRSLLEARNFEVLECKRTPCDLAELNPADLADYDITVWADDPGGISILARKV